MTGAAPARVAGAALHVAGHDEPASRALVASGARDERAILASHSGRIGVLVEEHAGNEPRRADRLHGPAGDDDHEGNLRLLEPENGN